MDFSERNNLAGSPPLWSPFLLAGFPENHRQWQSAVLGTETLLPYLEQATILRISGMSWHLWQYRRCAHVLSFKLPNSCAHLWAHTPTYTVFFIKHFVVWVFLVLLLNQFLLKCNYSTMLVSAMQQSESAINPLFSRFPPPPHLAHKSTEWGSLYYTAGSH